MEQGLHGNEHMAICTPAWLQNVEYTSAEAIANIGLDAGSKCMHAFDNRGLPQDYRRVLVVECWLSQMVAALPLVLVVCCWLWLVVVGCCCPLVLFVWQVWPPGAANMAV